MNLFILDASATLPAAFDDESSEYSDSIFESLAGDAEALTPAIWASEVTNALRVAEIRGRITAADANNFLLDLETYPVDIVPQSLDDVRQEVLGISRQTGLTVYDASYLFLAVASGAPIASEDERMLSAAQALGVDRFLP